MINSFSAASERRVGSDRAEPIQEVSYLEVAFHKSEGIGKTPGFTSRNLIGIVQQKTNEFGQLN